MKNHYVERLKEPGLPGSMHWRSYVGPQQFWDIQAANQFIMLVELGLREHHFLCDVGCGSLRAGRILIPYLIALRYYGIEPEEWLIEDGIKYHLGKDMVSLRKPIFITGRYDFPIDKFPVKFNYILAQSILTHTDKDQARLFLSKASKGLLKDGIILATYSEGKDFEGTGWQYPHSISYSNNFMKELGNKLNLQYEQRKTKVLGLQSTWAIWRN